MCDGRVEIQQHKHGDENSGHESVFGRSASNKNVQEPTQENEQNEDRQIGETTVGQQFRSLNRQNRGQLGPVKILEELSHDKTQGNKGTHVANRIPQRIDQIITFLKSAGGKAIGNTGNKEQQSDQERQAGDER